MMHKCTDTVTDTTDHDRSRLEDEDVIDVAEDGLSTGQVIMFYMCTVHDSGVTLGHDQRCEYIYDQAKIGEITANRAALLLIEHKEVSTYSTSKRSEFLPYSTDPLIIHMSITGTMKRPTI